MSFRRRRGVRPPSRRGRFPPSSHGRALRVPSRRTRCVPREDTSNCGPSAGRGEPCRPSRRRRVRLSQCVFLPYFLLTPFSLLLFSPRVQPICRPAVRVPPVQARDVHSCRSSPQRGPPQSPQSPSRGRRCDRGARRARVARCRRVWKVWKVWEVWKVWKHHAPLYFPNHCTSHNRRSRPGTAAPHRLPRGRMSRSRHCRGTHGRVRRGGAFLSN